MAKQNYHKYVLRKGREVVYKGITRDPERREEEHRDDKNFSKMNTIGRAVTKKSAEAWEEQSLKSYRKSHKGKNPKYNKTKK